jgi:putative endonuclease
VSAEAWVYLLRCADGSLYAGWTVDLERRVARHAAGTASAYTRSRRPVEVALALPMADRSAARREEARIKALPRADKLALVAARSQPGRLRTSVAVRSVPASSSAAVSANAER